MYFYCLPARGQVQNSRFNLNENFKLNLQLVPGVQGCPREDQVRRLAEQSENSHPFLQAAMGCPTASWAHFSSLLTKPPLRTATILVVSEAISGSAQEKQAHQVQVREKGSIAQQFACLL